MIISCPNCSARYKVKDGLITEKGKTVKCKKCAAVFIAYAHKDSVLARKPAPSPPPAAAQPAPQATVRVDRSKLEAYVQNTQAPPAEPKPEATPAEEPAAAAASNATIQVDRSQIDAYVNQRQEDQELESNATVKISTAQVDASRWQAAPPPPDDQPQPDPEQALESNATVKIDVARLTEVRQPSPEPSAPVEESPAQEEGWQGDTRSADDFFNKSGFEDTDQTVVKNDVDAPPEEKDEEAGTLGESAEPEFPSDEALGLDREEHELAQVSQDPAAFDFESPAPPANEDASEEGPFADEGQPESEVVYKARVDGAVYPQLTLESIGRWIEEGRLLESDEIAVDGTDEYRRADEFSAIVPFFINFYGSAHDAPDDAAPPKKKSFFQRIKSIFSKS